MKDQEAASGYIFLGLEDDQKPQIQHLLDDPQAMWKKLEDTHLLKHPVTRFNAYNALLGIRKAEDESLPALTARVEKAMQDIKILVLLLSHLIFLTRISCVWPSLALCLLNTPPLSPISSSCPTSASQSQGCFLASRGERQGCRT